MDDIVAVSVTLKSKEKRYFLTWGRIQERVDSVPLEKLVLKHSSTWDLGGEPVKASLCYSLQDASGQPYFYEALFIMSQQLIPDGAKFKKWKSAIANDMKKGGSIFYCGNPKAYGYKRKGRN